MSEQSSTRSRPNGLSPAASPPLARLLTMGIGVRIFTDTSIQIFGPYLPAIAAGLGISIVTLGALNSVRSLTGLAAPVAGAVADRHGYRPVMRALLLLGAGGCFLLAASSGLVTATIGILLMGIGVFCFAPVLQAYLSAQIPYERRARGLGIVEYAWALASIIGLSSAGLMVDRWGWRTPFWVLGVGLLVAFFVFAALPATQRMGRKVGAGTTTGKAVLHWRAWPRRLVDLGRLESNVRSTRAAIAANGLNIFATSNFAFVYGVWLSREYGLTASLVGLVALSLGVAELSGSVLASLAGDRFGKYRSILLSTTASVFVYALLPFLNFRVLAIVLGLLLMRFLFEVNAVSTISLLSEQVPTQRGKVLTLAAAAVTSGMALASFIGPVAYDTWGVFGPGIISAVAAAAAAVLLWRRVRERDGE